MVYNKYEISEKEMVDIYIENLKKLRGDKIIIFKEVKKSQKRIDIVEVTRKKNGFGTVHGIEFKVSNWRTGFRQALGNRVLLPFNSLAIWNDYKDRIKKEELINEGIGLIIVKEDKNVIQLKPKKSKYLIKINYQKIRNNLKEQYYD